MKTKAAGALVSRGVGLGLLVLGATSLAFFPGFESSGLTSSGWTSYSPLATNAPPSAASSSFMTSLHDTYYVIANHPSLCVPSGLQILIGVAMLWWSKTVGVWLTRGLDESDDTNG